MSNDKNSPPPDEQGKGNKDYKDYLKYLKTNKQQISAWIGKASDIYGDISQYSQGGKMPKKSGSIVAPDGAIQQGGLVRAVEIARLEWVKAKLESEDPVELSQQYSKRMARLNDEYHHGKVLFPNISVVGFMKDPDSNSDRLLVTNDEVDDTQVFAVDPKTGIVIEVFEVKAKNCLFTLRHMD